MAIRRVWRLGLLLLLDAAGCGPTPQHVPSGPIMEEGLQRSGQDSMFTLWRQPPPDSVVLYRNGAAILLSMRDVEAYYAGRSPLASDETSLYSEIRLAYERSGWVQLREGVLEDLLAAHLLVRGRALVRTGVGGATIRAIRSSLWSRENGTTIVDYRFFFRPDGTLLLKVVDSVTVS